jgi:mono/diheme cytochrome c family protein
MIRYSILDEVRRRRSARLSAIGIVAVSLLSAASLALAQRPSESEIQRGQEVFEKWCAGCHDPDPALQNHGGELVGRVFAGTYLLEQRYHGSKPAALTQRTDLKAAYIRLTVRQGRNIMPRTRKTEVSDSDLDAIVAYLTSNNKQ